MGNVEKVEFQNNRKLVASTFIQSEYPELYDWINESPYFNWSQVVASIVKFFGNNTAVTLTLYSSEYQYTITVSEDSEYMHAIMSDRAPIPGETWTRSMDLIDGDYSKETFDAIMGQILSYELLKIENNYNAQ